MINLSDMKVCLRISNSAQDSDIEDTMAAAVLDMSRVGIDTTSADDELTDMLVKLYCKWQLDYNEKGDRYGKQYNALRDALSMSSGYREA